MDISSFSDDNFDTKAWVNNVLKSSENQEKKENYTMSLVMKLQLYVQQVNAALESTSEQVLESLPKIVRDTRNLQEEALVLKEKMAIVKDEVVKIERETGNSITNIERLDSMKNKLLEAKQGLHESDNWTVLVNDLEELFDTKNIEAISSKLNSMQKSLKLLVNVADYEDRKLQLEGLKNRLEALASPSIVQTFTSHHTEQSLMYARIFLSIGRTPQLLKYYHKCEKDGLMKKWRSQLEVEQDETVPIWIHNFYDILLTNWHTQYKWFNQVFPNQSVSVSLMEIYADVLTYLDPGIGECIDAALKQTADKLGFLQEIKQIIQQFTNNFQSAIESTTKGKDNASSTSQLHPNLLTAMYQPLVSHIANYAAYEQAHLTHHLNAIHTQRSTTTTTTTTTNQASTTTSTTDEHHSTLTDTIHHLSLAAPTIFDNCRSALTRCATLTSHCGYCGLLIALRAYLTGYCDHFRVVLRQLDRARVSTNTTTTTSTNNINLSTAGGGGKRAEAAWGTLQLAFGLLQAVGEVLTRLSELEGDLTTAVLMSAEKQPPSLVVDYKQLLLTDSGRRELESLLRCVAQASSPALLDHVRLEFSQLCADTHHMIVQVALQPICVQLAVVQMVQTWQTFAGTGLMQGGAEMPDYSFTPQEYITQIGQYLMTLPQHLEPFLFGENPSLANALRVTEPEYSNVADLEGALTDIFLAFIVKGTCQAFCDNILNISELSQGASRQLAHDIGYLGNVVEDLGLSLTDNLIQISTLLKLPSDQYQNQSTGCPARYVAAIRQIRNITSSG